MGMFGICIHVHDNIDERAMSLCGQYQGCIALTTPTVVVNKLVFLILHQRGPNLAISFDQSSIRRKYIKNSYRSVRLHGTCISAKIPGTWYIISIARLYPVVTSACFTLSSVNLVWYSLSQYWSVGPVWSVQYHSAQAVIFVALRVHLDVYLVVYTAIPVDP